MMTNELKNEQPVDSNSQSETENSAPELPHPPHLPTPESPTAVDPGSPTSSGSTPEPHFSTPGHLDPPV